jgi:hypothetical protein
VFEVRIVQVQKLKEGKMLALQKLQIFRAVLMLSWLHSKGITDGANGTPDEKIEVPVYWEGVLEGSSLRSRLCALTKCDQDDNVLDLRPLEKHQDEVQRRRSWLEKLPGEIRPPIRLSAFRDPVRHEGALIDDQVCDIPLGRGYPSSLLEAVPRPRLRYLD